MVDYPIFDPDSDDVIERVVIEHDVPMTERSSARRTALQVLYEIDAAGHPVGEVLTYHLQMSKGRDRRILSYLRRLVMGVTTNMNQLDAVLQQHASEWPLDQVSIIDRNILRIALYEFAIDHHAPVGVAIDEAVDLAALFGAEGSTRFINGVLGVLGDNVEAIRETLADAQYFPENDEDELDEVPVTGEKPESDPRHGD